MTLIAQANILDKLNQQRLFPQRTSTTNDNLKTLSFNVYSSRHLVPASKETSHRRMELPSLPPLTRNAGSSLRKTRRPSYRTSLYHSILSNVTPVALPLVNTSSRSKPKPLPLLRDESLIRFHHHPDPPPTPSDDSIDHLSPEIYRTPQTTAQFPEVDRDEGLIPYRLPVLSLPVKPRPSDKQKPMKHILSDYYQTLYSNC